MKALKKQLGEEVKEGRPKGSIPAYQYGTEQVISGAGATQRISGSFHYL